VLLVKPLAHIKNKSVVATNYIQALRSARHSQSWVKCDEITCLKIRRSERLTSMDGGSGMDNALIELVIDRRHITGKFSYVQTLVTGS